MKIINTQQQLKDLAAELGVRKDWHEPDEQGVDAKVAGFSFDNAMGPDPYRNAGEMAVVIYQHGEPVASVSLATLLAWATKE